MTIRIAYILTRPLCANIVDFLASDTSDGGMGLGTLWPSLHFLAAILLVVCYLTITKIDRTERADVQTAHDRLLPEEA